MPKTNQEIEIELNGYAKEINDAIEIQKTYPHSGPILSDFHTDKLQLNIMVSYTNISGTVAIDRTEALSRELIRIRTIASCYSMMDLLEHTIAKLEAIPKT